MLGMARIFINAQLDDQIVHALLGESRISSCF